MHLLHHWTWVEWDTSGWMNEWVIMCEINVWNFFLVNSKALTIIFCSHSCSKKQRLQLRTAPSRILPTWQRTINSHPSSHQIMCRLNPDPVHNHYHKIINNNQWDRFRHRIVLRLAHDLCLQLWVSSRRPCIHVNYLLQKKSRTELCLWLGGTLLLSCMVWGRVEDERLFFPLSSHSTPSPSQRRLLLPFPRLLYKREAKEKNWKWYGLIRGVKNVCNHKNV